MAELYLEQGHRDQAVQVYRAVLRDDPQNKEARERLSELMGGGAAMVFDDATREFVNSVPGAVACSIMGFDGIAIATYEMRGGEVNTEALLTEYTSVASDLLRIGREHPGLGDLEEVTIGHGELTCIMRAVTAEHFVAGIVGRDAITGRARYALRMMIPAVRDALS
ncbi:MAG: tetratricopeptide repeat protein [Myxococcota bacterium]|nr:tetratricopeptide repeat protein [Myxococcota bacterium]